MITRAIQSLINWSIRNCADDNIWEYNKARLWSHLVLEDTGGPVRGKGGQTGGTLHQTQWRESVASEAPSGR